MRFYDLFAGIGGFRLGLERAGFQCVGSCEIEKNARKIYGKNFGAEPEHGNIREVDAGDIPDHDILTAGFPCQPFSYAGKRLGTSDIRGTLFYEIVRIIRQKRPRILLLENVHGLLTNYEGRTFTAILNTLDGLGYDVEWQVLDGSDFLPQVRPRVFIVGHSRSEPVKQVFPLGEAESEITFTGKPTKIVMLAHTQANIKERVQTRHNTWTLDTSPNKFGIVQDGNIRRLTPLECERLQGFPDGWTDCVSDPARYRCLGNAVMPPVVEYIARHL